MRLPAPPSSFPTQQASHSTVSQDVLSVISLFWTRSRWIMPLQRGLCFDREALLVADSWFGSARRGLRLRWERRWVGGFLSGAIFLGIPFRSGGFGWICRWFHAISAVRRLFAICSWSVSPVRAAVAADDGSGSGATPEKKMWFWSGCAGAGWWRPCLLGRCCRVGPRDSGCRGELVFASAFGFKCCYRNYHCLLFRPKNQLADKQKDIKEHWKVLF